MHQSSNTFKSKMISIAIAILVWFVVFGVLHTLTKFEKDNYLVEEKEDAENYGELLRSSVDRELNSLLFISNGLASYLSVYKDELDPIKINAILEDLWNRAKHVRNLGVAVGLVITRSARHIIMSKQERRSSNEGYQIYS